MMFKIVLYSILFFFNIDLNSQQFKILKPKEIKFSTPFSLIIELDNNINNVTYVSTETLKNSDYICTSIKIKKNKIIAELIAFNVGISTFPSITINVEGSLREIKTPPLPLEIKPLYNPKETDEIKDITPIVEFLWWIKAIIIALVFIFTYIIISILTKNKKKEVTIMSQPDTRTPYEKAMDRIKELISKKLIEQDKIKEYYTELSDILRKYIEEEFFIPATQMTTNELIKRLKNDIKIEIIILLREFLEISDLVKFAKYIPEIEKINKNTIDVENLIKTMNQHIVEKRKEEEKLKNEAINK
ncbi:MAG: hypothetical protein N2446_00845 [Elusimicrobiales bacterium]|nr:hypothetical protein [Elusimicrobiales bacterium]